MFDSKVYLYNYYNFFNKLIITIVITIICSHSKNRLWVKNYLTSKYKILQNVILQKLIKY